MKKSRKIFGAVALSAVLAFGTAVPAFADNTNMTGEDVANTTNVANINQNSPKGDASTTINIATYSSHYSVTLPLALPFMLDQQGGDGVAPTGYYIQNNGEKAAVEIWNVSWEMNDAKNGTGTNAKYTFGFADTLASGTGKTLVSGVQPQYGSFVIKAASTDTAGKPNAKFATTAYVGSNSYTSATTTNQAALNRTELGGTASKDGAFYNYHEFANGAWVIAAADNTTTPGTIIPERDTISLSISGTALGNGTVVVDEKSIDAVASLMYTIGPKRA